MIARERAQEWFTFTAAAGKSYAIETMLGTLDDTVIDVIDTDGKRVLVENDDDERGTESYASYIEWTAPADGGYYVAVEAFGSSAGARQSRRRGDRGAEHGISGISALQVLRPHG